MFETIKVIDYQATDASAQFVESLHETGFGVLKNHPIQPSEVQSIYKSWQVFFASEEKYRFSYNKDTQDGFFSSEVSEKAKGSVVKDLKEYFHYYPWGQCPVALKEQLNTYYLKGTALAAELLSWVQKHSPHEVQKGFHIPLNEMIEGSEQTLLRVLHYPPLLENRADLAERAAPHTDINLLTLLPAASARGLQILNSSGHWFDVPAEFGYLIVNIGDMLQEASQGYFPSTVHRVVNPEGKLKVNARISLPLFLHPRPEVVLSARYTAKSYLEERLKELGV